MQKLNCWEFKRCGREAGGKNASSNGVCPASTRTSLDGVHNGVNAGRACWVVAGTMCETEVKGTFAKKYDDCGKCDFYRLVQEEEGDDFLITLRLLKMVKEKQ